MQQTKEDVIPSGGIDIKNKPLYNNITDLVLGEGTKLLADGLEKSIGFVSKLTPDPIENLAIGAASGLTGGYAVEGLYKALYNKELPKNLPYIGDANNKLNLIAKDIGKFGGYIGLNIVLGGMLRTFAVGHFASNIGKWFVNNTKLGAYSKIAQAGIKSLGSTKFNKTINILFKQAPINAATWGTIDALQRVPEGAEFGERISKFFKTFTRMYPYVAVGVITPNLAAQAGRNWFARLAMETTYAVGRFIGLTIPQVATGEIKLDEIKGKDLINIGVSGFIATQYGFKNIKSLIGYDLSIKRMKKMFNIFGRNFEQYKQELGQIPQMRTNLINQIRQARQEGESLMDISRSMKENIGYQSLQQMKSIRARIGEKIESGLMSTQERIKAVETIIDDANNITAILGSTRNPDKATLTLIDAVRKAYAKIQLNIFKTDAANTFKGLKKDYVPLLKFINLAEFSPKTTEKTLEQLVKKAGGIEKLGKLAQNSNNSRFALLMDRDAPNQLVSKTLSNISKVTNFKQLSIAVKDLNINIGKKSDISMKHLTRIIKHFNTVVPSTKNINQIGETAGKNIIQTIIDYSKKDLTPMERTNILLQNLTPKNALGIRSNDIFRRAGLDLLHQGYQAFEVTTDQLGQFFKQAIQFTELGLGQRVGLSWSRMAGALISPTLMRKLAKTHPYEYASVKFLDKMSTLQVRLVNIARRFEGKNPIQLRKNYFHRIAALDLSIENIDKGIVRGLKSIYTKIIPKIEVGFAKKQLGTLQEYVLDSSQPFIHHINQTINYLHKSPWQSFSKAINGLTALKEISENFWGKQLAIDMYDWGIKYAGTQTGVMQSRLRAVINNTDKSIKGWALKISQSINKYPRLNKLLTPALNKLKTGGIKEIESSLLSTTADLALAYNFRFAFGKNPLQNIALLGFIPSKYIIKSYTGLYNHDEIKKVLSLSNVLRTRSLGFKSIGQETQAKNLLRTIGYIPLRLSDKLNVSKSFIASYLYGKTKGLRGDKLIQYADTVSATINYVYLNSARSLAEIKYKPFTQFLSWPLGYLHMIAAMYRGISKQFGFQAKNPLSRLIPYVAATATVGTIVSSLGLQLRHYIQIYSIPSLVNRTILGPASMLFSSPINTTAAILGYTTNIPTGTMVGFLNLIKKTITGDPKVLLYTK